MKIFCLSIYNQNYKEFEKLNLIPVGLGETSFDDKWINDKGKINISYKNKNFGEYTFHYHLWKNNIIAKDYNDWIGFCTYRRFWTPNILKNIQTLKDLDQSILKEIPDNWNNFEVILGEPIIFKKIKNSKLIKRNIFEVLKKPTVLFKNTSLKDQFNIFHGSEFLKKSLNFLSEKNRINFESYLNKHELNPYNMFICKNQVILNQFYEEIFPWLFKCEEEFKNIKLKGYDKTRIYGFLAERYMPYWFKQNYKTTTCPITFFETKAK